MTIEMEEKNDSQMLDTEIYDTSEVVDELLNTHDEKSTCNMDKNGVSSQNSFSDSTSLPHGIISPIPLDNLPLNIIEQLKQKGGMITSISPNNISIPPHFFNYPQQQQENNKKNEQQVAVKSKVLTADEKRQRRLLRNRLAAKDCRKKKKEYIQNMASTIDRLEKEQVALRNQVQDLKNKISLLPDKSQQVIMDNEDNYKLMKEVEMLNAKLGNITS